MPAAFPVAGPIWPIHQTFAAGLTSQVTDTSTLSGGVVSADATLDLDCSADSAVLGYGVSITARTKAGNTANYTNAIIGCLFNAEHRGSGDMSGDGVYGMFGRANSYSAGTVSTLAAAFFGCLNEGGGEVTYCYALYLSAMSNDAGTVINNYGLFIEDCSGAGSSASFNIWSDGGGSRNYFAGSIWVGAAAGDPAAKVQIDSTTQGFLPPRMATAEKAAISSPPEGLMVYDTDLHKLCVWTGAAWETITSA